MSLMVVTPETVHNPRALRTGTVPRKILKRVFVLPRRGERSAGLIVRLIAEVEALRYLIALTPFVAVGLIWTDLALPLAQAPLLMVIVIGFFELRVLRPTAAKREKLMSEDEAVRIVDTLNFRARAILSRIAARPDAPGGEIMLVVEQSDLAQVPTLTLVSLQTAEGRPRILSLGPEDRAMIRAELFDEEFTERRLQTANLRENVFLRSVVYDTRGVTAHARLAALLEAPAAAPA